MIATYATALFAMTFSACSALTLFYAISHLDAFDSTREAPPAPTGAMAERVAV